MIQFTIARWCQWFLPTCCLIHQCNVELLFDKKSPLGMTFSFDFPLFIHPIDWHYTQFSTNHEFGCTAKWTSMSLLHEAQPRTELLFSTLSEDIAHYLSSAMAAPLNRIQCKMNFELKPCHIYSSSRQTLLISVLNKNCINQVHSSKFIHIKIIIQRDIPKSLSALNAIWIFCVKLNKDRSGT